MFIAFVLWLVFFLFHFLAMDSGMDEKQINQCCCGNKTKRSLIDEVRSLKERLILKDSVINELLKSNQRNGKVSSLLPKMIQVSFQYSMSHSCSLCDFCFSNIIMAEH